MERTKHRHKIRIGASIQKDHNPECIQLNGWISHHCWSILTDKEDQLRTLDIIKAETLQIERSLEEKQRTSTNDDGSSRVLNTSQINQISNNTQPEDEVDAIGRQNFISNNTKL